MEYKTTKNGTATETALSGRFTFLDHASFRALTQDVVGSGTRGWVIDLKSVPFIDSAALGMLLLAREQALGKGIEVVLRGGGEQVKAVMQIAKFDTLFVVED